MSNLKEIVRKRIIVDMIRAIQPASKWKIVVVDAKSLRILNSVCKMHDILEENVTLVEDISRKRTSYSQKEAIYFLTPCPESVTALIDDFSRPKPMYAAAHVFFTAALPDELFDKMKASPQTLQHLKNLKELFIDFLRERPFIRYYDPNGDGSSMSFQLAQAVDAELEDLIKKDPEFFPPSNHKKAILMIAERPFDLMAPFLHEFTYQAMINDLLVTDGGKYVYHDEGSEDSSKGKAALDETDAIWTLIRYWHFAEAVEYIRDTFSKFLGENKAALSAMGHDEKFFDGIQNLNQLKDTLTSLPEFQEMKSKFSVHINICQECKSLFERRKLDALAAVEQVAKIQQELTHTRNYDKLRLLILYIIAQEGILDADRRRLLEASKLSLEDSQAITNLSLIGVKLTSNSDKKKKKEGKYTYYSRIAEKKKKKKKKVDDELPYDLSRYVPMVKYLLEVWSDSVFKDGDNTQDQVNNSVDNTFPWVREPLPEEIGAGKNAAAAKSHSRSASNPLTPQPNAANAYSLRTTRPSWAAKPKAAMSKDGGNARVINAEEEEYRRNGPRVILFMIGGITFSEIRATFEVMKDYKRDIIIGNKRFSPGQTPYQTLGSTALNNPTQYIKILRELHKPDGYNNLGSQNLNSSLTNLVDSSVSPKGSAGALNTVPAAPAETAKETAKEEKDKKGLKNIFKKKN
ncbi:vacuolar sorting protein VPS33/slp1 [Phlyctochytrium planicorne]|nr:vacuolar sorting protein VPS33/slp1 [Phlyctochytrium planicorne]